MEEKSIQIQQRKVSVNNDLSKAEPALIKAQQSLDTVEQKHLVELKSYPKAPEKAEMAVGAVVCLLNNLTAKPTWKECKEVLSRNDFI